MNRSRFSLRSRPSRTAASSDPAAADRPRAFSAPHFVGIDLGTTQSAIAVYHRGEVELLAAENAQVCLLPSAVHVDAEGRARCGAPDSDAGKGVEPGDSCHEHKRMLGSASRHHFPTSGRELDAVDMATLVLETLLGRYRARTGHMPASAVISVPASFGLPQHDATAKAAMAAGVRHVELVQEPIAAALAAGWDASRQGHWLVYDLGGGTFDVSLLEGEDGFARVVDHAGDPYLGGRDIDTAIARWLCAEVGLAPSEVEARTWTTLRRACEQLKLRVSETAQPARLSDISTDLAEFLLRAPELTPARLESLYGPLVERSLAIVQGLLSLHGLSAGDLERVVLVGGPTQSPALRRLLAKALSAPLHISEDPMLLVAKGAALFATANGLEASASTPPQHAPGCALWMRHPPITADLRPDVVGRVASDTASGPATVVATRTDGQRFEAHVDTEGGFVLRVDLVEAAANRFSLHAEGANGERIATSPDHLEIRHGLTIDEPPLSQSVGIALADDRVHTYFERGTPLPARRTFVHRTVEHVAGSGGLALKIPIVQGEYDRAHLCRSIGTLELRLDRSHERLPAGSEIEVILELDRSGRLEARARLPGGLGVREHVAHLLVPAADPVAVQSELARAQSSIDRLRQLAFKERRTEDLVRLGQLQTQCVEAQSILDLCELDLDASSAARGRAAEITAALETLQDARRLVELESAALATVTWANTWVSLRGTPRERTMLEEHARAIDDARERGDTVHLQRQTRLAAQLGESAWLRDPRSWGMLFERICADLDRAIDLPRAHALVDRGREALAREDWGGVRSIVERLRPLMPVNERARRMAHGSGVR